MKVTSGHIAPVDAYFDYASPWSYLAFAIAERRLPNVTLRWRPIYLRGLEAFATGIPYTSAKLTYSARDLARCCEHEGVVINPPTSFPVDGLQSLRAAVVAEERGVFARYHEAAFHAVWRDQKDISNKDVVAALLAEAIGDGSTPADLVSTFAETSVKERLKRNTAEAIERGVFGVPAFFVGDELYWGHDRLDYVARAVAEPTR